MNSFKLLGETSSSSLTVRETDGGFFRAERPETQGFGRASYSWKIRETMDNSLKNIQADNGKTGRNAAVMSMKTARIGGKTLQRIIQTDHERLDLVHMDWGNADAGERSMI